MVLACRRMLKGVSLYIERFGFAILDACGNSSELILCMFRCCGGSVPYRRMR